ncbi:transposase [Lentzea jiangxiensis]|uniref:Transposase n=1 Tax=Lentzea jiangxiensis TaxID=641025 RepID=A0A1H0X940_9PSEU|nr:transposase [Lentzea jiangxiensis]
MAPPKKYPNELRERATRMVVEARRDPAAATGAIKRIADQLGIHPEALRTWVKRAEIDAGDRPGTTAGDAERSGSRSLSGRTGNCAVPTRS